MEEYQNIDFILRIIAAVVIYTAYFLPIFLCLRYLLFDRKDLIKKNQIPIKPPLFTYAILALFISPFAYHYSYFFINNRFEAFTIAEFKDAKYSGPSRNSNQGFLIKDAEIVTSESSKFIVSSANLFFFDFPIKRTLTYRVGDVCTAYSFGTSNPKYLMYIRCN